MIDFSSIICAQSAPVYMAGGVAWTLTNRLLLAHCGRSFRWNTRKLSLVIMGLFLITIPDAALHTAVMQGIFAGWVSALVAHFLENPD
jgi:hypothetical protein